MKIKKIIMTCLIIAAFATLFVGCGQTNEINDGVEQIDEDPTILRLATTTSTKDSGLLDYILPTFEEENNIEVEVLAQGTGQAIETASMGDADVILVHAKSSEEEFVAEGYGVERFDVMYNDFVIVGPKDDPAEIMGMTVDEAFTTLSSGTGIFLSRGDDSGTNKKEIALWSDASIEPEGDWYMSVGKGMGDTLTMANEVIGYTLTDRATYLFMKDNLDLEIMVEGDEKLLNPYGVIAVNPEMYPEVNNEGAQKFIDFLLSDEGQGMIKEYKVNGDQLFFTYE